MYRVFVLLLLAVPARADTLAITVPPQPGEKYKNAEYRLWLPAGVKPIKAIIVRQHGCGRNGITHAEDVQWQALAAKHDAGLLGVNYPTEKDCSNWFDPANGTERAFLAGLAEFAKLSKHPELAAVPWAIWGHSGGSMWACHMANRHPDRVVAVWGRSQAVTKYDAAAFTVPIAFNYGEKEKAGRFAQVHTNSVAAAALGKEKHAPWAVVVDPKSEHDCRNSRALAIPFFDAMLAARLPDTAGGKLRPVTDPFPGKLAALRDEYLTTGEVKDITPPPAPTRIFVTPESKGVTVSWQAVADVESGIKLFHIYRDGAKVGSVGGVKSKTNPNGYYQIWNYGDEPEPPPGNTTFADPTGSPASKYEVVTENHAGLLSPRTK